MSDDGSQQRKPDFQSVLEDVKALATVLVMELESVLGRRFKLRSPAVLAAIGVVATLALALVVVTVLLQAGDANAVSDNAALIGALVALGGVLTAQMVSIALDDRRSREARDLEAQRAGEAALQNYFEQVGELLIEKKLRRASPGDNLSTVVRAQTLAVLEGLDPDRKRILLLFLYESRLIDKSHRVLILVAANLSEANLSDADFSGANLSYANLSYANLMEAALDVADLSYANLSYANLSYANLDRTYLMEANLSYANLRWAHLSDANLSDANLSYANLSEASLVSVDLREADLSYADFSGANLRWAQLNDANLSYADFSGANLSGADLSDAELLHADFSGTNLSGADLSDTDLYDADLSYADLSEAHLPGTLGWIEAQLSEARTLVGATMPDGQILKSADKTDGPTLEEWLKSQGRWDGENE